MKRETNWRNKDFLVCWNLRADLKWKVKPRLTSSTSQKKFITDIEVTINKFFKIYNELHDLASCSKIEICSTNLVTIPPIQRQWTYFLHFTHLRLWSQRATTIIAEKEKINNSSCVNESSGNHVSLLYINYRQNSPTKVTCVVRNWITEEILSTKSRGTHTTPRNFSLT